MAFVPQIEALQTSKSKAAKNIKFDASRKMVEVLDEDLQEILFAINVTDGIVLFDPTTPAKTATRDDNRTLILAFDTTSMNDADDILVIYEPTTPIIDRSNELLSEILDCLKELKIQMSLITGFNTEQD